MTGLGNADDEYWECLARGEFRLPRCANCARWTWPAQWRCGACGSWEFKWERLEPVGRVYSWTRSWVAFDRVKERAGDVPYVTVLAEISAADGARVLGILDGSDVKLAMGATVRGAIEAPSPASFGLAAVRWTLV